MDEGLPEHLRDDRDAVLQKLYFRSRYCLVRVVAAQSFATCRLPPEQRQVRFNPVQRETCLLAHHTRV